MTQQTTILIMEDVEDISSMIARVIQSLDSSFRVLIAGSGQEGLAKAKAEPPDLIIIDLNLPDATGDELIEHLRQEQNRNHPLIMGMSGGNASQESVASFQSLCDEFLFKPFLISELREKVASLLATDRPAKPSSKKKNEPAMISCYR